MKKIIGEKNDQKPFLKGNQLSVNWSCNKFNEDKFNKFQQDLKKKNYELRQFKLNFRESFVDQKTIQMIEKEISKINIQETYQMEMISCRIQDFEILIKLFQNHSKLLNLQLEFGAVVMKKSNAKYIASVLSIQENLQRLKLSMSGCSIGDEGMAELQVGFQNLVHLKYLDLDLSFNQLGAIGGQYLSKGISFCQNLSQLKIDITDNDYYSTNFLLNFGEGLVQLRNLKELELTTFSWFKRLLEMNKENLDNLYDFFLKLQMLQNLEMLKLNTPENLFTSRRMCQAINNVLNSLTKLKIVKIDQYISNFLNDLLNNIQNHQHLVYLSLHRLCSYNDNKVDEIKTIKKCLRLVYFNYK